MPKYGNNRFVDQIDMSTRYDGDSYSSGNDFGMSVQY